MLKNKKALSRPYITLGAIMNAPSGFPNSWLSPAGCFGLKLITGNNFSVYYFWALKEVNLSTRGRGSKE